MPPTFLDNDLNFTDNVLMGLDSMDDGALKGPDDITNLFNFNLWWSAPMETLGIKKLENVLYETSTNVESWISNELSSLQAIDFYGTISTEKSTGNTHKMLVHNLHATSLQMRYILIKNNPISSYQWLPWKWTPLPQ